MAGNLGTGRCLPGFSPLSRRQCLAWPLPLLLPTSTGAASRGSGTRLAVVIGNATYAQAPLPGASKDAVAIGSALRELGYDVLDVANGTRESMLKALQQVSQRLGRAGIGLLYYAGHGVQIDWQNYLVPVDARVTSGADVREQAVNIQAALDAFRRAEVRINIIILDACRDNPFGRSASGLGLAPIDAPTGTFLAYATAPGKVAEEGGAGSDGHGLYTRHLLEELKRPDVKIEDLFKRVRLRVRQASNGRQIPWESTSLEEDFVFRSGARIERESHAERERHFVEEQRAWESVRGSDRVEDYFSFLQRHPSGAYAESAQRELDRLQKLPPQRPHFQVGDEFVYDHSDVYGSNSRVRRFRVTGLQTDRIEVNGGSVVWDPVGNLIADGDGVREPAKVMLPANLTLGLKWRTEYRIDRRFYYYDYRAVAREPVEVPAGRFVALRLVGQGWAGPPDSMGRLREQNEVIWVDPITLVKVKWTWSRRGPRGGIEASSNWELRSMRLAGR